MTARIGWAAAANAAAGALYENLGHKAELVSCTKGWRGASLAL